MRGVDKRLRRLIHAGNKAIPRGAKANNVNNTSAIPSVTGATNGGGGSSRGVTISRAPKRLLGRVHHLSRHLSGRVHLIITLHSRFVGRTCKAIDSILGPATRAPGV